MNTSSVDDPLISLNPATGEVLGQVHVADAADIDAAVTAATDAQGTWRGMTGAP